jgi:predicted ribosome quality control (RQC) complex YloA/Tae2 family protein
MLLLESGVRMHVTAYEREKDKMPSNFCMKLRKVELFIMLLQLFRTL